MPEAAAAKAQAAHVLAALGGKTRDLRLEVCSYPEGTGAAGPINKRIISVSVSPEQQLLTVGGVLAKAGSRARLCVCDAKPWLVAEDAKPGSWLSALYAFQASGGVGLLATSWPGGDAR